MALNEEKKDSLLPSLILVRKTSENFDPFHDFFPEKLKDHEQYWYFGEILKEVVYNLEDRDGKTLLDRLLELRLWWNTTTSTDPDVDTFFRELLRDYYKGALRYFSIPSDGSNPELNLRHLSESSKVKYLLSELDTDGFSQLLYLLSGREMQSYEDLQAVLALQRLKGTVWSLGVISVLTGYRFGAFYRRYPTGRQVKVKRYQFGRPRYGDAGIYNGMWVYGNNVFFTDVEVDEYYMGPGWEEYFGIIGRPVIYDGQEVYTPTGELVYGEIKFIPDPCEVWIVSDVFHLQVDENLSVLGKIVEGVRKLLSPCSEVYLFPFLLAEEGVSVGRDSVEIEEVSYFVGVLKDEGVVSKAPDEVLETDMITNPKLGEYARIVEEVS